MLQSSVSLRALGEGIKRLTMDQLNITQDEESKKIVEDCWTGVGAGVEVAVRVEAGAGAEAELEVGVRSGKYI